MVMFGWLVAAASAGELWLQIEGSGDEGGKVSMTFPATVLRTDPGRATLQTVSGAVDLREEARSLGEGKSRRWVLPDGGSASLTHAKPGSGAATSVRMGITGQKGLGLELTFPLEAASLAGSPLPDHDVDVSIDGLDLSFDAAACAQLRRSPPMTLFELTGAAGGGFRARTD